MNAAGRMVLYKTLVWVVLLVPLAWLGVQIAAEVKVPGSALGADPGEAVVRFLGEWSLRLLLLTLTLSSVARRLGWALPIRFRRQVGLFALFYVSLHLTAYLSLLAGFDFARILVDLTKRPYIVVGFSALLCLIPLAVTSTRGWQRRLGRRWRSLHRLIYLAAVLAVTHFVWLSKDGSAELALMVLWLVLLLLERAPMVRFGRRTI